MTRISAPVAALTSVTELLPPLATQRSPPATAIAPGSANWYCRPATTRISAPVAALSSVSPPPSPSATQTPFPSTARACGSVSPYPGRR